MHRTTLSLLSQSRMTTPLCSSILMVLFIKRIRMDVGMESAML